MRLGIIGGGQLARMMVLEGHRLGLSVAVLCQHQDEPAAQVAPKSALGSLKDLNALRVFLTSIDVCTFESEFVDIELLRLASMNLPVKFHPALEVIEQLQDRKSQKEAFDRFTLKTANWISVENEQQAENAYMSLGEHCKEPAVVFKQRRFGYDGYGTVVVRSREDLKAFQGERLPRAPHGWIAESLVPFHRELAVTFVRDAFGNIGRFPFVETRQTQSRCHWVQGPIQGHRELRKTAIRCEQFLAAINYVGCMTFELFEFKRGRPGQSRSEILVNEIAPRVHNSCHYSLDLYSLNQFSAHLLAVSGVNLKSALKSLKPSRSQSSGFAMVNLLGTESVEQISRTVQSQPAAAPGDTWIHWYGKTQSRPGRKLGHITARGSSARSSLKIALKLSSQLREKWRF